MTLSITLPCCAALALTLLVSNAAVAATPSLRCHPDGTFKVMMYSDIQDGPNMDPRATALIEKLLDTEKPDLVVIGGDVIAGDRCKSVGELKQAIAFVAAPLEARKIPWAIVFGNHDQEHFPFTQWSKKDVMGLYMSYPNNRNVLGPRNIFGVGNDVLLVRDSQGRKPVFAVWLIDSNEYATNGVSGYDWIRTDQIAWYSNTSASLEKKHGKKIPGIMCFHIPLREYSELSATGKIKGDRNEPECPAPVNSGMLAAVVERGDVKGIFVGHDHTNNYVGEWLGVQLGYDGSVTYASYNRPDDDPKVARGRGARVFEVRESDPWKYKTWMRFSDLTTE